MTFLNAILSLSTITLAVTSVLISLRNSTLHKLVGKMQVELSQSKRSNVDCVASRIELQELLKRKISEYDLYISKLKKDISALNADLDACSTPELRRNRIDILLKKAFSPNDKNY